jgi:hypothetical protein
MKIYYTMTDKERRTFIEDAVKAGDSATIIKFVDDSVGFAYKHGHDSGADDYEGRLKERMFPSWEGMGS